MAESLVRGLQLTAAVETGTYLGDSARVLRTMVTEVWTIERSEILYSQAQGRHRHIGGIHFLLGDSAIRLAEIAPRLRGPVLYWLDAHWCEGNSAGADDTVPILEEIATIDASPTAADSCILIDDADFFLGGPWDHYRKGNYPSFMEVADALRARHDRYVTTLSDVIIAAPPSARAIVEDYWRRERELRFARADGSLMARAGRLARATLPASAHRRLRRIVTGH